MKKLILLLLGFFVSLISFAGEVTEVEALQKAQQFMQGKQFKQKNLRRAPSTNVQSKAYYVFNVEDNGGFVIVAGDDRMTDILGYSNKGSLNVDSIPDGLKWLLGYYEEIVQHIGESSGITAKAHRTERATIHPLMITEWGQRYPFNLQCPNIGATQCITGCVATAMAQVMNYCQWPEAATTSIDSYTSGSNRIEVPTLEPTTFNWNYMTVSELSKLMRYCGQSIQMDYGVESSGTFTENTASALVKNFGYDNGAKSVYHGDYTDEDWEELIYNEIAAKRVVIFGGSDGTGSAGHAFVIHGYDAGRFYINWGWQGLDDGYFALTGLTPKGFDFTYNQHAIIGIQPPTGIKGQPKHPRARVIQGQESSPLYFIRQDDGTFMEYPEFYYVSSSITENPIHIGYGLYNENGLQKVLSSEVHHFSENEQYLSNISLSIGSDIPDGSYMIWPISRANDSEEWLPDTRADVNCLELLIQNDLMRIGSYSTAPDATSSTVRKKNFVNICTIDGICYELYRENGQNRAIVLPIKGRYAGNVYIPEFVTYQGVEYHVYEASSTAFDCCQELTSLSTAMTLGPTISNCDKLTKLDLREGIVKYENTIFCCRTLEEVVYPKSVESVEFYIPFCTNLKSVHFKNPEMLNLYNIDLELTGLTDIYFYQSTPPSNQDPVFQNHEWSVEPLKGVTIHIPKGMMSSYKSSIWGDFELVEDVSVNYNTNQIYWGYCQSTNIPHRGGMEIENVRGLDREFAIHVPSELIKAYKNCKITGVQFYAGQMDACLANYVFVTKPGTDYLSKESVIADKSSWTMTKLSNPVTIGDDDLYVGIGRRDNIAISYSADNFEIDKNILMSRTMNPNGHVLSDDVPIGEWESVERTSPVCLRFIIEGENLPNDLQLNGVNVESNKLYATLFSRTPDYISSFTLNWELDGSEKGSQVISQGLVPNGQGVFLIDLPAGIKGFNHDIKFEFTDINGKPDAIPENNNKVYNIEFLPKTTYPRTAVMESVTGTWCGYSPRGTVGMRLLKEDFGNRFIPISIHVGNDYSSDIMQLPEYNSPIIESSSVPECYINRGKWTDPFMGEAGQPYAIKDDVLRVLNQKAPVAIGVNTTWANTEKTSVNITTSTVFGGDDDRIPYQLSYIILEDGLHGDGIEWSQNNAFSNNESEAYGNPYLMEYVSLPKLITDVKFDHVPVAAWGTLKGVEGTVPKSVKEGEIYEYTFKADITGNTHIQNKENLSVVVLVLNKNTGAIINATECKIGESSSYVIPGDVNGDGVVNVTDIVATVNYIMEKPSPDFNKEAADLNGDGEINVTDIVKMVSIIMSGGSRQDQQEVMSILKSHGFIFKGER